MEMLDPLRNLFRRHLAAQGGQLVHFDDLHVAAKVRALLREVGVNIQHPAIVMSHQAEAIVRHHTRDAGRVDPCAGLVPAHRIAAICPVIWTNGMRARLKTFAISGTGQAAAVREPFPRHRGAVLHAVERGVIDGRLRR